MASRKFSDLTPMQQGLILALLPVVLAVIVFHEFVSPLGSQAAQLRERVTTLHLQNLRGRGLMAQRAALQREMVQAQAKLAALRQVVPDQPSDDQMIKMLEGTARASSVHIRVVAASPAVRETYYTQMPFQAHLDGTYFGMLDFFTRLAANQRIVNVSGLSLSSSSTTGGKGSYKLQPQETVAADCILTTFYNSPPPAAPSSKPGVKR